MSEARTLGVGVIGLGLMGRVHIQAYRAAAEAGNPCKLVAVCDTHVERLDGRARGAGNLQADETEGQLFDPKLVRTSTDPKALFLDPHIDLVSICTPTDSHVELAMHALAAGKHVLVEKPVAIDPGEVERLALEAQRTERMCMPAMCMRFWPGWSWLKAAIDDRRYGAVKSASFERVGARPAWGSAFYADSNRTGGALFDLHVHDVDLIAWLFGAPEAVTSAGSIDHVTTLYRFAAGPAHVVAEGGWVQAANHPFQMRFRVDFERASAEYDLRRTGALEITDANGHSKPELERATGYELEIRAALDAVREREWSRLPSLAEAALVTRILLAERHALASGTATKLEAGA